MGKKQKTVKVPQVDPTKLITQQAQMNQVNQSGPFGSQTYGKDASGHTTLNTELSPEMQAMFNQQMARASAPAAQYALPAGYSSTLAKALAAVDKRL